MNMKSISLAYILLLGIVSGACSQATPIPRTQLAQHLEPILSIEKRVDHLKYYTDMLTKLGQINDENTDALKAHHDVYYVYYVAANVQLAGGNVQSYLAHVKLAESELDKMEAILKDNLSKYGESERGSHFPTSEM